MKSIFSFQRALAAQQAGSNMVPSHSSERLISDAANAAAAGAAGLDSGSKSDFAYYSEMLPPELARQLMMGKFQKRLCLFQFDQRITQKLGRKLSWESSKKWTFESFFRIYS